MLKGAKTIRKVLLSNTVNIRNFKNSVSGDKTRNTLKRKNSDKKYWSITYCLIGE